jgi:hypothetical protein
MFCNVAVAINMGIFVNTLQKRYSHCGWGYAKNLMQRNLMVGMLVYSEILFTQRTFQDNTAEADLAVPCGAEMGKGLGTGSTMTFSEIGVDPV